MVTQEHSPKYRHLVSVVGNRPLTRDEREAVRGALAYELVTAGLDADDEPNEYWLRLDSLIGKLASF